MHFCHLVEQYGTIVVAIMVALECVGLPIPGEAVLIAAAIYAGTHTDLHIASVLIAAFIGAVAGNAGGYLIGRKYGYPLLVRYGPYIRLTPSRIKIGEYLFRHHGAKVVVIARFVALLRSVAGILAGAIRMPLRAFMLANVAGAVVWVTAYGLAAYYLGHQVRQLAGPAAIVVAILVLIAVALIARFLAHNEARLAEEAEREFPGPL